MNIATLAAILLVGRLISEFFITMVLIKQWKIRNTQTHPRLMQVRRVLFALALIVFIGNLYPIWLDAVSILTPEIRSAQVVNLKGVIYTLDNNLTFLAASVLIWTLYKLSDVVIEVAELIGAKPLRTKHDRDVV